MPTATCGSISHPRLPAPGSALVMLMAGGHTARCFAHPHALIARADAAFYGAKHAGHDQVMATPPGGAMRAVDAG